MKKEISTQLGKRFLLGVKDGEKYYLVAPSWDCDWYWGCGYIQTYNKSKRDIDMHTHFDSLFFKTGKDGHTAFTEYFDEITLSDKEVWILIEMMKTVYNLKESAEVFGRGGSHYTTNPCKDVIIDVDMTKKINDVMLPALFEKIETLLTVESEVK